MNLEDMKGAVILLGLIAMIGAAVGISLNSFQEQSAADIPTIVVTQENHTYTNNTWGALTFSGGSTATLTCINVTNHTDATAISSTLWGCSPESGFYITNNGEITADAVNVSYMYAIADESYNITQSGLDGVANTTGYLDTIGTIIGVAVLIGIVVLAFTFVRR